VQVIVISGKAQNGKDTTAGFLKEALEADGNSVLIAHYGDLVKYVCKMYFGWNGEKDEYGRSLLQYVGTDVIRAQNENYWVQFVGNILTFFNREWDYVLIPDCRFPNEVNHMKELGFDTTHIRVIRDGFISPLTEEQQKHPSETALDNITPDTYIHNDGSLSDLREKVIQLVTDFNGNHQMTFEEIID
jgi:hypothetical protein